LHVDCGESQGLTPLATNISPLWGLKGLKYFEIPSMKNPLTIPYSLQWTKRKPFKKNNPLRFLDPINCEALRTQWVGSSPPVGGSQRGELGKEFFPFAGTGIFRRMTGYPSFQASVLAPVSALSLSRGYRPGLQICDPFRVKKN